MYLEEITESSITENWKLIVSKSLNESGRLTLPPEFGDRSVVRQFLGSLSTAPDVISMVASKLSSGKKIDREELKMVSGKSEVEVIQAAGMFIIVSFSPSDDEVENLLLGVYVADIDEPTELVDVTSMFSGDSEEQCEANGSSLMKLFKQIYSKVSGTKLKVVDITKPTTAFLRSPSMLRDNVSLYMVKTSGYLPSGSPSLPPKLSKAVKASKREMVFSLGREMIPQSVVNEYDVKGFKKGTTFESSLIVSLKDLGSHGVLVTVLEGAISALPAGVKQRGVMAQGVVIDHDKHVTWHVTDNPRLDNN